MSRFMRVEITLSMNTFFRGLLALTAFAIIAIAFLQPFFIYGDPTTTLTSENDQAERLMGTWTNGIKKGKEGFTSLTICDGKTATLTRIIDGKLNEEKAEYKYSKGKGQLNIKVLDEEGEIVESITADFRVMLQYGLVQKFPIAEYIARPYDHEDLSEMLSQNNPDYREDNSIKHLAFIGIVCIICIISGVASKRSIWCIISGFTVGVMGILSCAMNPILQMGNTITLIICNMILVIVSLGYAIYGIVKKKAMSEGVET